MQEIIKKGQYVSLIYSTFFFFLQILCMNQHYSVKTTSFWLDTWGLIFTADNWFVGYFMMIFQLCCRMIVNMTVAYF